MTVGRQLTWEQQRYLQLMGITVWLDRSRPAEPQAPEAVPVSEPATASGDLHVWESLRQQVAACTRCELHRNRTQTVFGTGNRDADWLVIGEAPGAEEDRQGEPFVGRAGKLLNAMLAAIGLEREQVYIANILKCLRYNALVQLGDGSWERIGRLVRARYSGEVMSVDQRGFIVPRRVTGWHETPVGDRRVFRLSYRYAKNAGINKIGIQLTGDHEVLTRRGYVPVEKLKSGDQIATGQGLSSLLFDVICGSLLGDSTLNAKCSYLSFSHSIKQYDYALYKANLLKELDPRIDELNVAARVNGEKIYPVVMVRTLANRALRILRKEFFPEKKRVPQWLEEKLNSRMLAFWFMDDGYTRIRSGRKPIAEIATCGFPEEDLFILKKGLSRLGLSVKVRRGRLYFDTEVTVKLSKLIAPYVPPSMRYKLHPDIAEKIPYDPNTVKPGQPEVFYDDIEIQDITDQPRIDKTFFCIDVEETNNFVTSGGVVHNCRPPNNRDPRPPEVSSCEGYLQQQITMIRPKIILALGRIAAQNLLKIEVPIGRMRGQRYTYGKANIPVIVTYHPAYLLRSPREKRKSWQDLQLAMKIYQEPG